MSEAVTKRGWLQIHARHSLRYHAFMEPFSETIICQTCDDQISISEEGNVIRMVERYRPLEEGPV